MVDEVIIICIFVLKQHVKMICEYYVYDGKWSKDRGEIKLCS